MESLIYGPDRGIRKSSEESYKITKRVQKKPYADRLKYLDLPTLRFRRCRGDMTETQKLLNKYDNKIGLPSIQFSSNNHTRCSDMKMAKSYVRHDIRKHFFHTPDS